MARWVFVGNTGGWSGGVAHSFALPAPTVEEYGMCGQRDSSVGIFDDGEPEPVARWVQQLGSPSFMREHRGGVDGRGSYRCSASPCPSVHRSEFGNGVLATWDDGAPEDPPLPDVPPYAIPPTAEILASPRAGLTVASTFSGAGGSCLGWEWEGFDVKWASEFVDAAADTHEANFPRCLMDRRDIRTVSGAEILGALGIKVGELDVLEGSPPCESFSSSGIGAKGWGRERHYTDGKRQRMDDLFDEYVRLVAETRPRAFAAENVSGFAKGASKGYFKRVVAALKGVGYRVQAWELDAQWLGVPQRRVRIFLVGVRDDLDAGLVPPAPWPFRYSIADAIPLSEVIYDPKQGDGYRAPNAGPLDPGAPMPGPVTGNTTMSHWRVVERDGGHNFSRRELDPASEVVGTVTRGGSTTGGDLDKFATDMPGLGVEWRDGVPHDAETGERIALRPGLAAEWKRLRPAAGLSDYQARHGSRHLNLVRDHERRPVGVVGHTGSVGAASVTHPTAPRKFTIAELRRLCGFPDDFVLTGRYSQRWERLGNSVPPPMARAVAASVARALLHG